MYCQPRGTGPQFSGMRPTDGVLLPNFCQNRLRYAPNSCNSRWKSLIITKFPKNKRWSMSITGYPRVPQRVARNASLPFLEIKLCFTEFANRQKIRHICCFSSDELTLKAFHLLTPDQGVYLLILLGLCRPRSPWTSIFLCPLQQRNVINARCFIFRYRKHLFVFTYQTSKNINNIY